MTWGRWKRFWFLAGHWAFGPFGRRGATGSVRGSFRRSRSRSTTPRWVGISGRGPPSVRSSAQAARRVECTGESKWGERRLARAHSGLDCRKVVRRRSSHPAGSHPSRAAAGSRGSNRGLENQATMIAGARVVSRLQKSVRSIFRARSRGAERRAETSRGSAARNLHLDEGRFIAPGDKGARRDRANVTGNAMQLHSTARSSIEPMEGALVHELPSLLTRRRRSRAWRV